MIEYIVVDNFKFRSLSKFEYDILIKNTINIDYIYYNSNDDIITIRKCLMDDKDVVFIITYERH